MAEDIKIAEDIKDRNKKMARVIARAWSDDSFKERLLAEPCAVLRENGVLLPEGVAVKAVENTDKVFYVVLPAKPENEDLASAEERIAAFGVPVH